MRFSKFAKDKRLFAKILIIVSLLVIDLVTKVFFAQYFSTGNSEIEILGGFLTFTYLENTGAAFGSFSSGTILLTIISFVFCIVFIVIDIFQKKQTRMYTYGYTLIIAGALGNLVDRLFLGYVRDFLRFSIFNFVCNIADICICLGVLLYMIDMVITQFRNDKGKEDNGRKIDNN